jgi:hypothetical protein
MVTAEGRGVVSYTGSRRPADLADVMTLTEALEGPSKWPREETGRVRPSSRRSANSARARSWAPQTGRSTAGRPLALDDPLGSGCSITSRNDGDGTWPAQMFETS